MKGGKEGREEEIKKINKSQSSIKRKEKFFFRLHFMAGIYEVELANEL